MTFAEFDRNALKIVNGAPKTYSSSERVERIFCGNCGSPLGYVNADYPEKIEIPAGAFDDLEPLAPQVHIWTSRKPSWLPICDHLPQREQ